jgi:hypothetical protein
VSQPSKKSEERGNDKTKKEITNQSGEHGMAINQPINQ